MGKIKMEEITETMEIENSGYENFEDQFKYKSVTLENERKAKIYGRITIIFCALGCIVLILVMLLEVFLKDGLVIIEKLQNIMLGIAVICYLITLILGINAQRMKKNDTIKMIILGMIGFFVGMPVIFLLMLLFFLMITGQL